jgi:hypothetical protein
MKANHQSRLKEQSTNRWSKSEGRQRKLGERGEAEQRGFDVKVR